LLEVHSPHGEAAREAIAPFAELVKSPEHIHTYQITPLSVWKARAAGLTTATMIALLRRYAQYPVPEGDVFALIGPKRYDMPWRELENQGFIAAADCAELRIAQASEREMAYALAPRRQQFRLAAENPRKLGIVENLLEQEAGHRILIIGEYLRQLQELAEATGFPLLTGKTPQSERERLYGAFRERKVPGLVLSRVGKFAVDF
jgi:hypothetical protein